MRDYAKISPRFWMSGPGKELRKHGPEAQIVALYLMTNPHANMLGLYYLPILFMAHETGLGLDGATKGLRSAIQAGFCSYDEASEVVWVHEMAAEQIGTALKPGDKQCAGVRNAYASIPENLFLSAFYEKYKNDFHLDLKRNCARGMEGASEGLRSKEKEKEKEKEKDLPPNPPGGDSLSGQSAQGTPAQKKSRSKPQGFDALTVELPDWLPVEIWRNWVEFRRALRKPIKTEQGALGAIRELDKYRQQGFTPESVIAHSVANEYQGLFAPQRRPSRPGNINELPEPDNSIPPGFRG